MSWYRDRLEQIRAAGAVIPEHDVIVVDEHGNRFVARMVETRVFHCRLTGIADSPEGVRESAGGADTKS